MRATINGLAMFSLGLAILTKVSIGMDLTAPPEDYQVPDKIDEEMAKDVAKYLYYNSTLENVNALTWNEIQVTVYPIIDIYGLEKSYLCLVYIGEGDMPDDELIKANVSAGYKATLKAIDLLDKRTEIPSDIENLARSMVGKEPESGDVLFYSTIVSEMTSGCFAKIGGATHGLPDLISNEPSVLSAVEELTGAKAIINGYFGCRLTGYGFEVLSNNDVYYVSGTFENWLVRTREEQEYLYDNKLEEYKQSGETDNFANEMFRNILYNIHTNPEIINGMYIGLYQNDNEGNNGTIEKGKGLEGYVIGFYQGTGAGNKGCLPVSITDIVAYEVYHVGGELGWVDIPDGFYGQSYAQDIYDGVPDEYYTHGIAYWCDYYDDDGDIRVMYTEMFYPFISI